MKSFNYSITPARFYKVTRTLLALLGFVVTTNVGDLAAAHPPVVPVGGGSYASYPPKSAGPGAQRMLAWQFPLVASTRKAIPTNKYWTWLLRGKASGNLWSYPWRVDPTNQGINLFFPKHSNADGTDAVCNAPLQVGEQGFTDTGVQVKRWGDWTLTFRLVQQSQKYLDVTLGEGMPLVWIQPHGASLTITADNNAVFLRPDGNKASFPYYRRSLIIRVANRMYGIYLPPNSVMTQSTSNHTRLDISESSATPFAAIAPLNARRDLAFYRPVAASLPIGSHYDWTYDASSGRVTTTWHVLTKALVPNSPPLVAQSWLPHQWMQAHYTLNLNGPSYFSPRGPLKTCVGNNFKLSWSFGGFLPFLPAPGTFAKAAGFNTTIMKTLLAHCANNPNYGDDTYWGGKDLLRFAQYMAMAHELGNPLANKLRHEASHALGDWLTYSPGEAAHYFAWYKNWHALVGFKDSYDSAKFNDQHFHYGYFTYSTALLAMQDPDFLKKFGPMITLVAMEYANWNRKDNRFPLLRTFDVWAGHSWAGGLGSPGGENQESSSEAMQSWIGLYLLGIMLDNKRMEATGAMGYAIESRAALDYWFNQPGDLFPPQYKHPILGMVWSGGGVWGTYFSGDPAWIYGIQCLPQSPGLDYLVRYRRFAKALFHNMLAIQKAKTGTDDLSKMGDLGNVMLAQASQADPAWAIQQFNRLWAADSPIVHDNMEAGVTYYDAHAYHELGHRLWQVHFSLGTAAAYFNQTTKLTSYVVYNPHRYPMMITAKQAENVLGCFVAPPRQMTVVHSLQPLTSSAAIQATLPADSATHVGRNLQNVFVVFSKPVQPTSLHGVKLTGPAAPHISLSLTHNQRVLVCTLGGLLQPGATYTLTLPAGVEAASGQTLLTTANAIHFTIANEPPLRLVGSSPRNNAARVLATAAIKLLFNDPIKAASLTGIHLVGRKTMAVKYQPFHHGFGVMVQPTRALQTDTTYTLVITPSVCSIGGHRIRKPQTIAFSTQPAPCPPNVYTESFVGHGVATDGTVQVDLRNRAHPHSGTYAIKITGGARGGSAYFFNGSSDHGDGYKPVNLTGYKYLQFYICGDTHAVWFKIGHPVFDGAFFQTHLTGITSHYKRILLPVPKPKDHIGTLFVISIKPDKTVYLDDMRFVKK